MEEEEETQRHLNDDNSAAAPPHRTLSVPETLERKSFHHESRQRSLSPVKWSDDASPEFHSPPRICSRSHLYKLIRPGTYGSGSNTPIGSPGSSNGASSKKSSLSPNSSRRQTVTSRHKSATREIAALDFLQNIPMRSEKYKNVSGTALNEFTVVGNEKDAKNPMDFASNGLQWVEQQVQMEETSAGRRMIGPQCVVVRIPQDFRYRLTTKYPSSSLTVRRWENTTIQRGLLDARLYLSSDLGFPVAVHSVIKFDASDRSTSMSRIKRRLPAPLTKQPTMQYDWRGKSYWDRLHSTWSMCDPKRDALSDHPPYKRYDAEYLDNPEIRQGRHRHVLLGDQNIGPVVSSILLYVKPLDLKNDLNRQFKETHTWLEPEMSLSKIRNLKREVLTSCRALDIEIATCALACVYFEKLILSEYVTKSNRKIVMSVCWILALKFSAPQSWESLTVTVKKVLEHIDRVHSISSQEVLALEFEVYAELSFALHVPLRELQPHFIRLLKTIESSARKYLGDDNFEIYTQLLLNDEEYEMHDDSDQEQSDNSSDSHEHSSDSGDSVSGSSEKSNSLTKWLKGRIDSATITT